MKQSFIPKGTKVDLTGYTVVDYPKLNTHELVVVDNLKRLPEFMGIKLSIARNDNDECNIIILNSNTLMGILDITEKGWGCKVNFLERFPNERVQAILDATTV